MMSCLPSSTTVLALLCAVMLSFRLTNAAEAVKENECECHCNAYPPTAHAIAATDRLTQGIANTNTNIGTVHQRINALEQALPRILTELKNEAQSLYTNSDASQTPPLPLPAILSNVHRMLEELTGRVATGSQLHVPVRRPAAPFTGVATPMDPSRPMLLGGNANSTAAGAGGMPTNTQPQAAPVQGSLPIDFVKMAALARQRQQQEMLRNQAMGGVFTAQAQGAAPAPAPAAPGMPLV